MKKITLSVVKADVGSIGGHTQPSQGMLDKVDVCLGKAVESATILDYNITYMGDDIALTITHHQGADSVVICELVQKCFKEAAIRAKEEGLYAPGQDISVNISSGNICGAGAGVAEIEFKQRSGEAFVVFTADKCDPGAYNCALWNLFCNPMYNDAPIISSLLSEGVVMTIVDTEHEDEKIDQLIKLNLPEESEYAGILLSNIDRYAVKAIHSRSKPSEQIVSTSVSRLHKVKGKWIGTDDPVMIVRTQNQFFAAEEVTAPFRITPFVTGGRRGCHSVPLTPVVINMPIRGDLAIVSALAYSMREDGIFADKMLDIFAGLEWDEVRKKALKKLEFISEQGFFGVALSPKQESTYEEKVQKKIKNRKK